MKQVLFVVLLLHVFKAEAQTSASSVADSLYAVGNYTKAINEYSKIGNASAALQIARSYNAIGNFEKAIAQYQFVTDENPDFELAHFELGKLLLKVGEFQKANVVFTYIIESNAENPEYYYYLGEVLRSQEQTNASLSQYKRAVGLDSTHLRSLFQLAKHYTIKQERDSALTYIEKGLQFYENDVAMINLKALVLYNDFQFENAIPLFERILELGENKNYVYEKLGYSYTMNWEFDKAKQAYNLLLNRDDTNSQTYFSLAKVYQKEKKLDSAKIFIHKALDVQKPIFAEGYSALANIARDQKDLKTALKYYSMAHDEDPLDARIYYNIATVNDQVGTDLNAKLAYYKNFLKQYPNEHPYFYESVRKRIRELKEEIHFAKE
ncbi:tetratricopeptide repeat protein [Maribacter arcticus]|uniref:tetratricopeptide repeat protein n=1 Tax=Maribacter arcticus TaxID=561365 RepID=UPI0030033D00